ncbi:LysR family transcriptional regulator [Cohnella rhizosphaerae]|uniref:LysR family transcriptional regulator n=1 Tax=Cohnella rhizosphaerae TaxID=1457232 RepID=A0A9X4KY19_9BACL|nr:LysR family transcriptional regulator [Cohnella rhizosphaerae]MDG0813285.1 LysR family transcriptional regulator [Cohnella rhizosphaerae]
MNIENIEAFVHVLHYGSFNKAAEALFLSQPSVTARIQSLERELDCQLFDRVGKQVLLTNKGKLFRPYAEQLLDTYRKGKQQVRQTQAAKEEVRIGCTVSAAQYLLPLVLPAFRRRHPSLRLKLTTATSEEIGARVLAKELDIGFVRKFNHPGLHSVLLYEDPIRLYVHSAHALATNPQPRIEDLSREPLLFFECGALDWLRIHRVFESQGLLPNLILQTDNAETAKRLLLRQEGVCFLPGMSVRREESEGTLVPIDFPETAGIGLMTSLINGQGENEAFARSLKEIAGQALSSSDPAYRIV